MSARNEYRYNRLTWEEMNDAITAQKLVILPTASTEQHGKHLPLDTDLFLTESICLELGRRAADKVLVLPPIAYGLNLHHIDFPGTVHIEPEVFIAFCLNIAKSVAYHGFEKILLVNGHGGNHQAIQAALNPLRQELGIDVWMVTYFHLGNEIAGEIRASEIGGMAHSGEFETAMMMHLRPELVSDDKVPPGRSLGEELEGTLLRLGPEGVASFAWLAGDLNADGVVGDARLAEPSMGARLVSHYGAVLAEVILDALAFPLDRLV